MTWSKKILSFLNDLYLDETKLPEKIYPLLPLQGENSQVISRVSAEFYNKYYNDNQPRKMIIGINPGRLGAGATGLPFTDTKRLKEFCDIDLPEFSTHEPSSVFVYEVIQAFGGPKAFYDHFYITSVCSVGFVIEKNANSIVNYNYYDSKELAEAVEPFIIEKLKEQITFGTDTSIAFCLGTGKNFKYLNALNKREKFFEKIIPLEHPRYVVQYKSKSKDLYIDKFLNALTS
ncbi:MAG: DUF4918 family protein [Chitinophagales bacterium]